MLYYLFHWLDQNYDFPGAGVFEYISFRAAMAAVLSLFITLVWGKPFIRMMKKKQIGETVRDLGLQGQKEKEGTPTMGGILILAAILIPTILLAKLNNIYVIIMLITSLWLGFMGFLDDYIKVFRKNKKGLEGKFKIIGQVSLGIIVGLLVAFHPDIVVKKNTSNSSTVEALHGNLSIDAQLEEMDSADQNVHSFVTTIPFVKNNEFNYSSLVNWLGPEAEKWTWVIFILVIVLVITATSNGANLSDGIDGLATGTSAIIGATLGILAWVSGNVIFSNYLNIMYIPNIGELTVFVSSFCGATIGFLWYNTYPAKIFMGDTGSLTIGGIIGVFAILIRKELLMPLLCGIFLIESLSVIIQVSYFKYTRKKFGEGHRIFLMTPLHHHFQKKNLHESTIVQRFFIIGILLAIITIVTLKLR